MDRQKQTAGISVLLCTFNGAARLPETLASLARQRVLPGVDWEIVLVDNASTDDTAQVARLEWDKLGNPAFLRVVQQPRPGKQFALEMAVHHAQYTYTCIVDDDNRLSADYLMIGYELLAADTSIGVLGGPNTATFEGEEPVWFSVFQRCYAVGPQLDYASGQLRPLADGNVGRNVLWGAGMFVRMEVWRALAAAGFKSLLSGRQGEQNLTAGEDDELCYAAQLLGYAIWYSSRLHLQHHMSANRLTESYRDRLFYASAQSATRLNAYRNALWGRQDSWLLTNLLKDTGYMVLTLRGKSALAAAHQTAWHLLIDRMTRKHTQLVLREMVLNFGKIKVYYQQIARLKRHLRTKQIH